MKRLLLLNFLLVLLMSGCSVITSSQAFVDGVKVDNIPTPEEVIDTAEPETKPEVVEPQVE